MKRYPEYKDSSVKWIGEIPKHWGMRKIKNTQSDLIGGVWGNEPEGNENDIYCIRVADFNYEQLTFSTHNLTLRNIPLKEKDKRILRSNDLLVEKSGGGEKSPVGKTVIFNAEISRRSVTSNFITKFTTKPDLCFPKYLLYCLSFFYHIGLTRKHIKQTTGIQNLDIDSYFQERIPLPTLEEQIQIVTFLDRKTEQIDELIRIKERRIELLQEQRTALINQAVTKGLDPNVVMKPSGVEWIGEIPKHWEIKKLKYIAKILPSNVDKHIYPDEIQIRLCNYTDVYYNDYITVDTVLKKGSCKQSEFEKFALRKKDIIITKDSETPDDIGVPTYVKDDLDRVVCGYHLTMIRPLVCRGEFIFRFIQADRTRRYFEVNSNGITRYGLGKASIENLLLPIPPETEQCQIANFLNQKTEQIDELIVVERRKIELLKEYRQSLISEAVTGKIDVRNEV